MKKVMMLMIGICLLLGSCGTYEGTGAYTGAQFGHVIGSAVGGISGGWRGHEVGSLIGTVGGAVAGAAIGSAADRAHQRKYEQAQPSGSRRGINDRQGRYDDSGYDAMGRGDDRITIMDEARSGLEIRNVQIIEHDRNGVLTRGEELTVVFEVLNHGDRTAHHVRPWVQEMTGNKHVHISKGLQVDRIEAHGGVRYTASVLADRGLRRGEIVLRIGVAEGQNVVERETRNFPIPTAKR